MVESEHSSSDDESVELYDREVNDVVVPTVSTCDHLAQFIPAVILYILLVMLVVGFQFETTYAWTSWTRIDSYPHCYCEQARGGFIEQPSNTFSNFAYILVGLMVLFHTNHGTTGSFFASHVVYRLLFGSIVLVIGFGSMFYHMSLTNAGRFFDWFGMFLFIDFLIAFNFARIKRFSVKDFLVVYVVMCLVSVIVLATLPQSFRTPLFALEIATLVALLVSNEIWKFHTPQVIYHRYLILSAITFIVAYVIWNLDKYLIVCWPTSVFQGHALWHILVAISITFIYFYQLSEVL